MTHRMLRRPLAILAAVMLCGCTLSQAAPTAVPTATTFQPEIALGSPVPTLARYDASSAVTSTPDSAGTQTAQSTAPAADEATPDGSDATLGAMICGADDDAPSTAHTVSATIDYGERTVEARHLVRHFNRTATAYSDLVFNIEPNYWLNAFQLDGVSGAATYGLTGRRLTVQLAEPLEPECAVQIEMTYRMTIPPLGAGAASFRGYFSSGDRQINLGHWLPTLALRVSDAWITREAFFAGEQNVLDIADWDVTLTLTNADGVIVAAPGDVEDLGDGRYHGTLRRARDYSISLSDQFVVAEQESVTGVQVALYTLGDTEIQTADGPVDGAHHALAMATRSLELFTERFGPYPYDRFVVVQGDFPDGMEFSGLVFVSSTWFERYTGKPDGYLTLITVHEVAHQWWYARVGSDAALSPWLDEALSTYSEHIFLEQFYPNLTDWWWQFRVEDYAPTGFVDSTVYEFTTIREYINAVYLNGVRMLGQIRRDLGDAAFFDLLARYAATYDGQVVGSTAFWSLMSPEQAEATRQTRQQFLRRP